MPAISHIIKELTIVNSVILFQDNKFLKTCVYVYFKDISLKAFSFVFVLFLAASHKVCRSLSSFTQGPNPAVEAES